MAEAHQAVAFQFAVTDEGVLLHVDKSAVQSALSALFHLIYTRYYRIKTSFLKGIFPATPLSLLVVTGGVFVLYAIGYDPSYGVLSLLSTIPRLELVCVSVCMCVYVCLCVCMYSKLHVMMY